MPLRFQFTILGEKVLDTHLQRIEHAVQDFRPAWEALHQRFLNAEAEQFSTEGAYGGARWAPLSPDYAARKLAMVGPKPILEREGHLMASLTSDGDPASINIQEPHMAVFGAAVEYARFHQAGGGNLPRRPVVILPAQEQREWVRLLQRFIITGSVTP